MVLFVKCINEGELMLKSVCKVYINEGNVPMEELSGNEWSIVLFTNNYTKQNT